MFVVCPGRARQVACRPLLDRRGEDIAARDEERALAVRAERERRDLRTHGNARRTRGNTIVGNVDGERVRAAVSRVEDVQLRSEERRVGKEWVAREGLAA